MTTSTVDKHIPFSKTTLKYQLSITEPIQDPNPDLIYTSGKKAQRGDKPIWLITAVTEDSPIGTLKEFEDSQNVKVEDITEESNGIKHIERPTVTLKAICTNVDELYTLYEPHYPKMFNEKVEMWFRKEESNLGYRTKIEL
jgi:hypothetical protein